MPIMTLIDVLAAVGLPVEDDWTAVLLRHTADTPTLTAALPTLAAEDQQAYDAFNAFHFATEAKKITARPWAVAGVAHHDGVLVTGLYRVNGGQPIASEAWWDVPGNDRLAALGAGGPDTLDRPTTWINLERDDRLDDWSGRLEVDWTGRRGYIRVIKPTQAFAVRAVHAESRLVSPVPGAEELVVEHAGLAAMPRSWWTRLGQWRGIYYIHDRSSGCGYVGAAYGADNLAQRWRAYATTGHGGNVDLRGLDPTGFVFSVLQLVAPTADPADVQALETSWKNRLSTRRPHGLNAN